MSPDAVAGIWLGLDGALAAVVACFFLILTSGRRQTSQVMQSERTPFSRTLANGTRQAMPPASAAAGAGQGEVPRHLVTCR